MASWCLIKEHADRFIGGLRSGEIDPAKLSIMTSEECHAFLSNYVGKDNAKNVNSLFESKLLLKNQQKGMVTWAKRVFGRSEIKRDLISRIEKMDKILNPKDQFLTDLASTRLGADVTQAEAKNIFDLSKKTQEARSAITEDMPKASPQRLEYGLANVLLKEYVGKLKADTKKIFFREQKVAYVKNALWNAIPDLAQTLQTTFDNSIWGRQLVTTLFNPRYSRIWVRNFVKSWGDIGKALKGEDPMLAVKAEVYSRPNSLNGKYDADPQGYGLGIKSEEVYSSPLPARIPVLNRLFKASEAAFNGGALRVRADIADLHIKAAESAGKNVLDKKFAAGLGNFVTSITGRANIQGEGWARSFLYAPRLYLADIHQLTSHIFDAKADTYVKKQAAKNLALTLGAYSLLFATAKMVDPESVDSEKHLGQIKIAGAWVDMTGGRASFVNLAAKMAQKVYEYSQGNLPKYGQATALDLLENFAENKLAPKAAVIKDILTGTMYGGEKVTLGNELRSRLTPLTAQDVNKLLADPKSTNDLAISILAFLGASPTLQTQFKKDWSQSPTKAQEAFKAKVGDAQFTEANTKFNQQYNLWFDNISQKDSYKNLSAEGKQSLIESKKQDIQDKVFQEYKFRYNSKVSPQTIQEKGTINKLKKEQSMVQPQGWSEKSIATTLLDKLIPEAYASEGEQPKQKQKSDKNLLDKIMNFFFPLADAQVKSENVKPGDAFEQKGWIKTGKNQYKWPGTDQVQTAKETVQATKEIINRRAEKVVQSVGKGSQENLRNNMPLIINALKDQGMTDANTLAYALATIAHETANTFQPIRESFYLDKNQPAGTAGKQTAIKNKYSGGEDFYGRGFIQITNDFNYKKYGEKLGIDLVKNPDEALKPDIAAKILALYFKERGTAQLAKEGKFMEARGTINQDSNAKLISDQTKKYLQLLTNN